MTKLATILGAAMMLGGLDGMPSLGGRSHRGENSRRYFTSNINSVSLKTLLTAAAKFADLVDDWNEQCINWNKMFKVQGFMIKGTSQSSATKRVRKFLAISGLEPDTEFELLQARIKDLKEPTSGIDSAAKKAKEDCSLNVFLKEEEE